MSRYHVRSGEHTPLEHTGYGAMAYMSAWAGNWFSEFYVGSAKHDYSLSRTIYTDSALGAADAAPHSSQILAGTRRLHAGRHPGLQVQPDRRSRLCAPEPRRISRDGRRGSPTSRLMTARCNR